LVSQAHHEKVLRCIDTARAEGGRIHCGRQALRLAGRCAGGWFIAPPVIEGLGQGCRSNPEESFALVRSLQPFEDETESLALANAVPYGLAASLWTSGLGRAHRLAAGLQSGIVWINTWLNRDLRTPFGGMKQSGLGREGGWEAMRFFAELRSITLSLD